MGNINDIQPDTATKNHIEMAEGKYIVPKHANIPAKANSESITAGFILSRIAVITAVEIQRHAINKIIEYR